MENGKCVFGYVLGRVSRFRICFIRIFLIYDGLLRLDEFKWGLGV